MLVSVSGNATVWMFVHPEKALDPICVTLSGMTTSVIIVQSENALFAIAVTGLPSYVDGIPSSSSMQTPIPETV